MVKTAAGEIVEPGKTHKVRNYAHHPRSPSLPNCPFVIYDELREFGIPFSRKHILDLMRRSQFPAARQISANRVAWVRAEIEAYVITRPIARAAQPEAPDAE
jgi:predicted DNA-binding transcriptional regulator AlpA